MEVIAGRAGLGSSTIYRHFSTRDDLMEAVLDELIADVRANVARADDMTDPVEAFRFVFAQSCVMPESDIRAFAGIAASSARLDAYARRLIEDTVGPVTDRVREAGRMRDDLTTTDVAAFVRLIDAAETARQRDLATEFLLDGMLR